MKFLIFALLFCSLSRAQSTAFTQSQVSFGQFEDGAFYPTVLNGNLVKTTEAMRLFTVMLVMTDNKGFSEAECTGFLIEDDIILTAGHCLKSKNLTVMVHFGLGGKSGYLHKVKALNYRAVFPTIRASKSAATPTTDDEIWNENGTLKIDPRIQDSFYQNVNERKFFVNFAESRGIYDDQLLDYAVVRIPKIPAGYKKIERFSGALSYFQTVYHLGYGYNSRSKDQISSALRWSEANLIGFYSAPGEKLRGWQTFSPNKQQSCYGDSGGPLIIRDGGKLKVLGINIFTINACGNANWYLDINYFENEIDQKINSLRQERPT